jgi:tripartite-type tricarboxylate transporter receptor subunit TctC
LPPGQHRPRGRRQGDAGRLYVVRRRLQHARKRAHPSYRHRSDFGPCAHLDDCDGYFIYSINATLPARTAAEFIALAKREPGKLNYGTPGAGGNNHVSGELFKLRAGVDIVPIHYKVAGAVTAALLSNEIQLAIQTLSLVSPYLANGRARALFITSKQRDPQLPDVPTSVELGLADLDNITNWFGIYAP